MKTKIKIENPEIRKASEKARGALKNACKADIISSNARNLSNKTLDLICSGPNRIENSDLRDLTANARLLAGLSVAHAKIYECMIQDAEEYFALNSPKRELGLEIVRQGALRKGAEVYNHWTENSLSDDGLKHYSQELGEMYSVLVPNLVPTQDTNIKEDISGDKK